MECNAMHAHVSPCLLLISSSATYPREALSTSRVVKTTPFITKSGRNYPFSAPSHILLHYGSIGDGKYNLYGVMNGMCFYLNGA